MSDKPAPKTFVVVASVDDPLSADRLVAVLVEEVKVDAFVRARNQATSDAFGAISQAYWEVLVQSDAVEKAQASIKDVLDELAKDAAENEKAAEEEAMSGENPTET